MAKGASHLMIKTRDVILVYYFLTISLINTCVCHYFFQINIVTQMILCCGMSLPVVPPRVKYLVIILLGAATAIRSSVQLL